MKKYQSTELTVTINDEVEEKPSNMISIEEVKFYGNAYILYGNSQTILDEFIKTVTESGPEKVGDLYLISHAEADSKQKGKGIPFNLNNTEIFKNTLFSEKEWEEMRFMLTLNRARKMQIYIMNKMGADYSKYKWNFLACGSQCVSSDDVLLRTQAIVSIDGKEFNTDAPDNQLEKVTSVFNTLKSTFASNMAIKKLLNLIKSNSKDTYFIPHIYAPEIVGLESSRKMYEEVIKTGDLDSTIYKEYAPIEKKYKDR